MKSKLHIGTIILMAICMGVLFILPIGCLKECCNDPVTPPVPIALTTDMVTTITHTSAQCGGTITSDGGDTITARGVCWSMEQSPTITDSITSDSIGIGHFTSSITGLISNTTYYVRAYAINSVGTAYGNERTFSTQAVPVQPTLTTIPITNITQTTATSGGTITFDGGSPVTVRGVCWSTSPDPTTADSKTSDGSGIDTFVSNLVSLNANTTYYVRAYAYNIMGTGYGNQQSFTTIQNPTTPIVTTDTVMDITQTTATGGGNVLSDGGNLVTVKGLCWSTSPNPTMVDNYTSDGNDIGLFFSYLIGLTPNISYYVRAYAINNVGIAYGNQVTFTTADGASCPGTPTFSYGGQIYYTVQEGTQCWMKGNLNIGKRINGAQIQINNGEIEKYCYNDQEANCDVYGGLYRWDEMMQYTTTPGIQGICPTGWHIPEDAEWEILINYIGDLSIAGGLMKSIGTIEACTGLWYVPNTGATNGSGFTGLPSGRYDEQSGFLWLGSFGEFWSSTEFLPYSWTRELHYYNAGVHKNGRPKNYAISIRCIKD